jgi:putative ABC transport system substrate-binding protein
MRARIIARLLGTIILASFNSAGAQQTTKDVPRVGFISSAGTPATPSPLFDAFRFGLRDLGYAEGKNVTIAHRYAEGRLDLMPALVNEFVQQKVTVIFAVNNVVIRAAKEATKTIPIVMISSVDPVGAGYVDSFAHPGGNITGLTTIARDLSAKRVELLKEVLPKMSRVGVLWDANGPGPAVAFKEYEAAARAFKLQLRSFEVRGPNPDLAGVFQAAKTSRVEALVVVGNPLMAQHATQVFELATRNQLPSIAEEGRYADAGGLVSYGANLADLYRRAAEYVVEILKGAKPGDLPVKLPSKFEIFINLKTAQQLGLVIPQHVLVQADKVIK